MDAQRKLATQYLTEARKLFTEGKTGYQEGEAGLALLRSYRAMPKNRPLIKFLSEDGVKVTLNRAENHYMQEQSKHMHEADEPLLFTIDEKNRQVELTNEVVNICPSTIQIRSFLYSRILWRKCNLSRTAAN